MVSILPLLQPGISLKKQLDEALRSRFDYLFGLLHDRTKMVPLYHASRIQNTSGTIGLLVDKYEAYGDVEDLKKASRLADWLMNTWQRKDGAYVNHNTVYTSVIYVAKSMLELTLVERELGKTESVERGCRPSLCFCQTCHRPVGGFTRRF